MFSDSFLNFATDYAELWWWALLALSLATLWLHPKARAPLLQAWLKFPAGRICSVPLAKGGRAYLTKEFWVIVEDKHGSKDVLPLNLVSQSLQETLYHRMKCLGYP